jgi:recombination protein RecA
MGLVRKSGSWYSLGDERIGQGRDRAVNFLEENQTQEQRLRLDILGHHGIGVPMVTDVPAEG